MKIIHLMTAVLLSTALAAPAAMAQSNGGTSSGTSSSASSPGSGNSGQNLSNKPLPSQRIVNGSTNTGNGSANGGGNVAAANGNGGTGSAQGGGAILTISPSGVRQVQQALNRLGYAAGGVNGVWDKATALAMRNFQQAHGLSPSGNLNMSSIAALGLWNNLIRHPIARNGKGNKVASVPPGRGSKKSSTVGNGPLPSQRIVNGSTDTGKGGAGGGANSSGK